MISTALFQYPQIRFKEDQKVLWNPVLKKTYVIRPEEQVRLQFIEYLLYDVGFSKSRISFESPVSLPKDKSASRTDIICYDDDFKPLLLVECKAPSIQLDEKAALQIARYNSEVKAPFLLVTNGMYDYWFRYSDEQITLLDSIPDAFTASIERDPAFDYWVERGFAGSEAQPEMVHWLTENATSLLINTTNPARYFPFEGTEPDLYLPNYYQVLMINEQTRLAVAFSSTPFGSTKFNAILNQGGRNIGLLSSSLDIVASEETANTIVQNARGLKMIDIVEEVGFDFQNSVKDLAQSISKLMM
ncbi:MAG: type I restriction enzyme HsdR N-terminal domain-containing protein [Balneolaceae bacterium]|nr:type I restriction enzyme HsdR N-terminal domain-containing protein [Balneolaceae bacterium]